MKSKKSKKDKKMKKRKKSKSLTSSVVGSDDDMNLDRKLYALDHYIPDKAALVEQMFGIIQGGQLSAMLPPALKDLPLPELKSLCLVELVKLSASQVTAVLAGDPCPPDSDASADSDAERKEQPDSTSVSEPLLSGLSTAPSFQGSQPDSQRASQTSSQSNTHPKDPAGGVKLLTPVEEGRGGEDLTLMELLELEMRARAIKALLERDETAPSADAGSSPPPPPPPPGSPPARVKASWKPVATPALDVIPPPPPTPPPPSSEPAPAAHVVVPPAPPAPVLRDGSKSASVSPKPVRSSKPRAYRPRRQSSSHDSLSSADRERRRSRRSYSRSSSSLSRASYRSPAVRRKSRRSNSSQSRAGSPEDRDSNDDEKVGQALRKASRRARSSSLSSASSWSRSRSGSRRRHRRRRRRRSSSSYSRSSMSSRSSRSGSSRRLSRSGPKDKAPPAVEMPVPQPAKRKPRPEELEEGEVNSEFESASDAEQADEERRWKEYNEEVTVQLGDGEDPAQPAESNVPLGAGDRVDAKEGGTEGKNIGPSEDRQKQEQDLGTATMAKQASREEVNNEGSTNRSESVGGVVTVTKVKSDTEGSEEEKHVIAPVFASSKEDITEYEEEAGKHAQDENSEISSPAANMSQSVVIVPDLTRGVSRSVQKPSDPAIEPAAVTSPLADTAVAEDSDASASRDSFYGFALEAVERSGAAPTGVTEAMLDAEFSVPGRADKCVSEVLDTSPDGFGNKLPDEMQMELSGQPVTAVSEPQQTEGSPQQPSNVDSMAGERSGEAVQLLPASIESATAISVATAEAELPARRGRSRKGRSRQRSKAGNVQPDTSALSTETPSKATKSMEQEKTPESPVDTNSVTPPTTRVTRSSPRKAAAVIESSVSRRSRRRVPATSTAASDAEEESAMREVPGGVGRRQSPRQAATRRSRTKSPAAATSRRSGSGQKCDEETPSEAQTVDVEARLSVSHSDPPVNCGDGSGPEKSLKAEPSAAEAASHQLQHVDTANKPDGANKASDPVPSSQMDPDVEESADVTTSTVPPPVEGKVASGDVRTVRVTKSPVRAPPGDTAHSAAGRKRNATSNEIIGLPVSPGAGSLNVRSIVTKPSADQDESFGKLSSVVVVAPAVPMKEIGKGGGDGVQLEKRLLEMAHGQSAETQPAAAVQETVDSDQQSKPDGRIGTKKKSGSSVVSGEEERPDVKPKSATVDRRPTTGSPASGTSSPRREPEAQLRSRGLAYWRELAAEAQHRYLAEEAETERLTRQEETRLQELEARLEQEQETDDAGMAGHTWAVRWLQSDKVQKVVNNSKLYNKVKQKLKVLKQKAVKPKEQVPEAKPEPKISELPHVIGSIEEYERLFGKKVVVTESQAVTTQSGAAQSCAPAAEDQAPPPAAVLDDDDDDDADLWGDIMGD